MLPKNLELLLWIDDRLGIEVAATTSGKTNFSHRVVKSWEEAARFADSVGLPAHHLVVPASSRFPQGLV